MLKSTPPAKPSQGNTQKYYSYREAWERIKQAQEHGFYLEAVTIVESILSDRLYSHLTRSGNLPAERHTFGDLIQAWWNAHHDKVVHGKFAYLQKSLDGWRKRRNRVVHAIVKAPQKGQHLDIEDFLLEAKLTAEEGVLLARALTAWCEKQKKRPK